MNKSIAVILAGGVGSRFDSNIPKQYVRLSGKMIVEHTIDKFLSYNGKDRFSEVIVVYNEEHQEYKELLSDAYGDKITLLPIINGSSRLVSTFTALNYINELGIYDGNTKVLIHDSVRPLVTNTIIDDCITGLDTSISVDTAIPCSDTIVKIDQGFIDEVPDRSKYYSGQTPQGFILSDLSDSYSRYIDDGFDLNESTFTDDCGLLKYMNPSVKIMIIEGSPNNLKITYKSDLILADQLLKMNGNDKLAYTNQRYLVLGGTSGIGESLVNLIKGKEPNPEILVLGSSDIDLSRRLDTERLSKLLDGRFDHVIISSGYLKINKLREINISEILKMVDINYTNQILFIKYLLNNNLVDKGSSITLFSSSSYTLGRMNYSIYSSCKAAIVNLSQSLSEELYHEGIRVNCVVPNRTNTPMRTKNFKDEDQSTLTDPGLVASRTYYELLKSKVTGQVLHINYR